MGNRTQKKIVKFSADSSDAVVCFITGKDPTEKFIQEKIIKSMYIGLSQLEDKKLPEILFAELAGKEFCHACIFLSNSTLLEVPPDDGLLIEYGDYLQDKKIMEIKYIYENEGGLRYYLMKRKDFEEKLAYTAQIEFDIPLENQMPIKTFIDKIGNIKQWTKEKYDWKNYNCQTFVSEAIKLLKPIYEVRGINIRDSTHLKDKGSRDSIIPSIILTELKNYNK